MDALDLLKSDHERVKSLFDQFQNESGRQQQILLFENMRNDLESHTLVEEQVFYPAFRNYSDVTQVIDESYKDHETLRAMLEEIGNLPDDSDQLVGKVGEMIQAVSDHIQREEEELFPKVRKLMKRGERERLGRHMQAIKQESPGIAA